MRTREELETLAFLHGFTYFTHYAKHAEEKRLEFSSAVESLGISMKDKTVLDIGPGTADSLDVAKDMGASKTWFVDEEPYFWRFATLKGHEGWLTNYTIRPYFPRGLRGRVDFVWTRGSINCAQVNATIEPGKERLKARIKRFSFPSWIEASKQLLKPGGTILLMPAQGYQEQTVYNPAYGTHHHWWCPDVGQFMASYFATTLLDHGFKPVRDIPHFNDAQSFPVGFLFSTQVSR